MKYYTLARLEELYKQEYPEMALAEIQKKAKLLHKEFNRLDTYWKRNNRHFYRQVELIGQGDDWFRTKQLEKCQQ
ncbi:MAG: hypothetical protein H6Q72_1892 [Firmicutes bacterium]|nr:hypothetical protein [Bacillota bacterium]